MGVLKKVIRYGAIGGIAAILLWFSRGVHAEAYPDGLRNEMSAVAFCGGGALLLGICIAIRTLVRRRLPLEWVFLAMFLPLSLAMSFCMPPYAVPDEGAHFIGTYIAASGQFIRQSNQFRHPERLFHDSDGMKQTVRDSLKKVFSPSERISLDKSAFRNYGENGAVYPAFAYVPQAMGMRIGMWLYPNSRFVFYTARLGTIILTTLMFFFAIRLLPCGKNIVLYVSLLPITLQETASVAVDGLTISVVALCVAFYLHFKETADVVRLRHEVLAGLMAFLLVGFKVMYLPFVAILFFIPLSAFGDDREHRLRFRLLVAGMLALAVAIWLALSIVPLLHSPAAPTTNGMSGKLHYLLSHPADSVEVFCRTLFSYLPNWIDMVDGQCLSLFSASAPRLIQFVFIVCCCYVFWQGPCVGVLRGRMCLIHCSLVCFLIVLVTLWLWWTPIGSRLIEGVQGRYLLPMLAPVLIAFGGDPRAEDGDVRYLPGLYLTLAIADVCTLASVLSYKWA